MSEFAARATQRMNGVRGRMANQGVDAMVLSHGADLPWLTGYTAMPLERLTALVFGGDGPPTLLVPELEAPRVRRHGALFDLRPYSETEDAIGLVCDSLGVMSGKSKTPTIAISDRAWAQTVVALADRLDALGRSSRFVVSSNVISALRAVKDELEIEALRKAAQAADEVAASLQGGEVRMLGRSERDISEEIAERLRCSGHRKVNFAIVGSGPNAASPHHDASDRKIEPGDVVVCDFGGELASVGEVGYCSDITRTVVAGEPGDEVVACYEVLRRAQQAGVESARRGVRAQDVDRAARAVIEDAGLGKFFIHRTGHGIGIEEHEDPYLVAGNCTELQVGHVFSVEPGIYMPGRFGMRLEDIVVVGSQGPERLNSADHSLVSVA